LSIEPGRGSLDDFPWPDAVVGADAIDAVAALLEERRDRR
jgi:hypothetical protein